MKLRCLVLIPLLFGGKLLVKASDTAHYTRAFVMNIGAGYNRGLASLGKRFPTFSTLPVGGCFKTHKNFVFGLEYTRFLGNNLTIDSLFGGIVGAGQNLIDKNGNPAVVRYYMRGFSTQFYAGKLFKVVKNARYGRLQVNFGVGYLQHHIKLRYDKALLPQLEGDYAAGYDRLCSGFMISQSVYYNYFNTKSLCFIVGLDCVQSFTKSQRAWDYSLNRKDVSQRKDFYLGFSLGVLIPIVLKSRGSKDYYE